MEQEAQRSSDTGIFLGIGGASLLFLGTFLPLISIPIVGSMNYFHSGRGDGVIIMSLALISLVLTIRRKVKWLWFTGLMATFILVYFFAIFNRVKETALKELQAELSDNPFRGLGEIAVSAVHLEWGWGVMLLGSVLLLAAAWYSTRSRGDSPVLAELKFPSIFSDLWVRYRALVALAVIIVGAVAWGSLGLYFLLERSNTRAAEEAERRRQVQRAEIEEQARQREILRAEEEAARRERLRIAREEYDRLEAEMEVGQTFEAAKKDERRTADVDSASATQDIETQRLHELERIRLELERRRYEEEQQRIQAQERHARKVHVWYKEIYSLRVVSFKRALGVFYESYRSHRSDLGESCRSLKSEVVSLRIDQNFMRCPDSSIKQALEGVLRSFDVMAVACMNGTTVRMESSLERGEASLSELARSLAPFSLKP